ncbi:MAG TPA: FimV/HubP family polar landmark protein, partial [Steroidobacteraceae bacterium]|nr:FimV/HubP family polar landmark protein [Steroidobacteraceae bacterium]
VPAKTAEMPRMAARSADDTMSSETAIHVDQQDAMAEADFHMAYGLYDQAADLVKIAIQREPNRRDLKFKLLEIFFVWGNKDSFLEAARELYQSRDVAPAGEWDRILVMGKQIAPENPMFKGGARSISDMIDVNLEGGENRVDIDLFAAPEGGETSSNVDFELGGTGSRAKPSKLDFLLDETANRKPAASIDETREMEASARTQETPTIESPALDVTAEQPRPRSTPRTGEQTSRERTVALDFDKDDNLMPASDQTAELSIDDLGLDVGGLESTGSLDRTTALKDRDHDQIGDDELTRLAEALPMQKKSKPSLEPTMEVPAVTAEPPAKSSGNGAHDESDDLTVNTIYLEQMETDAGEFVDTMGGGVGKSGDSTHMLGPDDLDVDLSKLGEEARKADDDTIRRKAQVRPPEEPTAEMPAHRPDLSPTVEHPRPKFDRAELVATTQLPEMEPVTMSEVGTKLDLARAYMDMGDPDGARSILEEVLGEGNSGQRAEAQRLLDSIR